jgi:hypothetical protein
MTVRDKHSSLPCYGVHYSRNFVLLNKPMVWTNTRGSAWVGSRVEMTASDKHSSLLRCAVNYRHNFVLNVEKIGLKLWR